MVSGLGIAARGEPFLVPTVQGQPLGVTFRIRSERGALMPSPLEDHFGATLDLGLALAGRNLNLLVFRGFASLEQLAAISAPDVFDPVTNVNGTQRFLDKKHADSCFKYAVGSSEAMAIVDPRAFPEIILNARDAQVVEVYQADDPDYLLDVNSFTTDAEFGNSVVGLRIRVSDLDYPHPTKNPQISRVDGNHRLSGADVESLLRGDAAETVPVSFCLYLQLTTDQEIKLFKDINGEHVGMDVNHLVSAAIRIGGDSLREDPDKVHIWMADQLTAPGMAFADMVFYGGSKEGSKKKYGKLQPLKLNTLASTIKVQLAAANVMRSNKAFTPERQLEIVDGYWKAVREVFPDEWADKNKYILLQTIGLTGFARLGGVLIDRAIQDGSASQSAFEVYFQAIKREVDLSRGSKEWEGVAGAGGGRKVADVLLGAATSEAIAVEKVLKSLGGNDGEVEQALDRE